MMKNDKYPGQELELFSHAKNWKQYVSASIGAYLHGDIAEVGAGTANFSPYLQAFPFSRWTYIEPDEIFRHTIQQKMDVGHIAKGDLVAGLEDVMQKKFNAIIYLDVLEHIENDQEEIDHVVQHLKPGGYLVVLSPAFNHLYSRFDKEIGHFRRYSAQQLLKRFPDTPNIHVVKYLDSVGYFTSMANRIFLKQKYPGIRQIKFWDRFLVPLSRVADKLFFHSFGRSILVIWQKQSPRR